MGRQHARNSTAGADQGRGGGGMEKRVHQRGCDAAQQIEGGVAPRAHQRFDRPAEAVEEQHVAQQMHDALVHE